MACHWGAFSMVGLRSPGGRRRRRRAVITVMVAALAGTGCGNRLDHEAIVAAHEGSRQGDRSAAFTPSPAIPSGEATAGDTGTVLGPGADTGPPPADGDTSVAEPATPGISRRAAQAPSRAAAAAPSPQTSPHPQPSPTVSRPGGAARRAAPPGRPADTGQDRTGPAPEPGAAPATPGTPVTVGSVGNYSGPAGNSQAPGAAALQVFARFVNERGGAAGHPVKVIVVDDGGDPARHQAAVKDLVENHGVLAFVANLASLTAGSARAYLEENRIPVIGGDVSTPLWFESPMFFPQGPNYRSLVYGMALTGERLGEGRTKLGAMTCQEAEVCNNVDRWLFDDGFADRAGLDPVYRGRISLTQPDFTAECLSARNAGVELLNVTGDPNTVARVAASCDRQGYHPLFLQHSATVDNTTAKAADGRFEALLVTLTFPWVASGTPATDEYRTAMETFGTAPSAATSMGWTAAKLFAAAAAAAHLEEPPTRAQLLDGLYSLQDERLGGLSVPLNYRRGAPAVDSGCWFVMRAGEGKWLAPQGSEPACP